MMIEGGGTEADGQEVEWGLETEVLTSLMFVNTLAQLRARFIRWFGLCHLCFLCKLFCSKGLTQ